MNWISVGAQPWLMRASAAVKEDVQVVFSSANWNHSHVLVFGDSREVGPKGRLQFLGDRLAAILGAKDHVDVIFGEGVRQCVAPHAARQARFRACRAAPGLDAIAPRLPRASATPTRARSALVEDPGSALG